MAYATGFGRCYGCKEVFTFNPVYVPSLTIKNGRRVAPGTPGAEKEPFCRDCMNAANLKRRSAGQKALFVHPEAYIACDESEL